MNNQEVVRSMKIRNVEYFTDVVQVTIAYQGQNFTFDIPQTEYRPDKVSVAEQILSQIRA